MDKVSSVAFILAITAIVPALSQLTQFGAHTRNRRPSPDTSGVQSKETKISFPDFAQRVNQQQEAERSRDNYYTTLPPATSNTHGQTPNENESRPTQSYLYSNKEQATNSVRNRPVYPQNVQYSQSVQPLQPQNVAPQNVQHFPPTGDRAQQEKPGQSYSHDGAVDKRNEAMMTSANAETSAVQQNQNLISTSVTGFGLAIMTAIEAENKGNSVVSPFSIALVLALLQQGAEGESQREISRALRLSPAQARDQFHALVFALQNRQSRNTLKIATSIFVDLEFMISPEYKQFAIQYFLSDLVSTSFRNSELAAKQINDWVSASTATNIPYLVSPDVFTSGTQIVLANAVYFKGLWNTTFNPMRTVDRPFNLLGGGRTTASFMHNAGKFQAGHDRSLDADWLVMPFEDLQYSLITIVPSEASGGVGSLLLRLSTEHILDYLRSPRRVVIISIPKFKVRIDTDLIRPLNALGIQSIFTSKSSLAALGSARGNRARVTEALHAAVLTIDERGGSAAAATFLAATTLSLDPYEDEFRFQADRPFVAMLWDNQLSLPLFAAKIVDPTLVY